MLVVKHYTVLEYCDKLEGYQVVLVVKHYTVLENCDKLEGYQVVLVVKHYNVLETCDKLEGYQVVLVVNKCLQVIHLSCFKSCKYLLLLCRHCALEKQMFF